LSSFPRDRVDGHWTADDLTARARIRDAALRLFAERGMGATVREIAEAAGVSSGLLRHHFGSKEALRDACDAYAMERVVAIRQRMLAEGRLADLAFVGSVFPAVRMLQNYLVRSMMDGSAAAAAMFDDAVKQGEEWLIEHGIECADPRAASAVLAAMKIGAFVLRDQISRAMGVDVNTPAGHARMNRAFVDVFAHPLLSPELTAMARAAFDQLEAQAQAAGS
jgi:AcrR family transcriptional regulator